MLDFLKIYMTKISTNINTKLNVKSDTCNNLQMFATRSSKANKKITYYMHKVEKILRCFFRFLLLLARANIVSVGNM